MPKPLTTLLSIDAARVLRADLFGPGSKEPLIQTQPRAGSSLADAVRAALASGCGRNVWVASDEIWGQSLSIPTAAVAGLRDAELSAALAFEAEPLSGIASLSAALGFVAAPTARTDGLKDFSAIAMESATRDEIQTAVKKAGGKLRGVTSLKDLPTAANEREWAERCAAEFERSPAPFPVIGPAPEKVSPLRYWVLALALEAAALAVCFYHHKWAVQTETQAKAHVTQLRMPQKLLAELKTKNDAAKVELKKLEEQNAKAAAVYDNAERETAFERARIPAILSSLAKDVPPNVAIVGILAKDPQTLHVDGLSLEPEYADTFATKLEYALAPAGMHAQSFSKSAQNLLRNGGPWKFRLQITSDPKHARTESAAPTATADSAEGDH